MSTIEPAAEKIVRNLHEAIEALRRDVSRVEMWAGALSSFTKPIPEYGHGQTRFDLTNPAASPAAQAPKRQRQRQTRDIRDDDDHNHRGTPHRAAGSTIDTSMLDMAYGAPQRD